MRKAFLIVLGLCFAAASPVLAFHDAGVAHCNGCHTMHNSEDGVAIDPDNPNGNPWLLVDESPSDVCLGCHATRLGAVFGDDPVNPPLLLGAGNFTYLLEDNINDGHNGANNPIPGYKAGHSIVAPGHGLAADGTLTAAPGGDFPASVLGCTSCHDPHGTEDFRMLYGAGRVVQDGVATFDNPAPTADGLSIFDGTGETNDNHTAYQSGMSAWCANCHGDFHQQADGRLIHQSGQILGGTIATVYDLYNGTASIQGGNHATAYLAAVPFEDPSMTTDGTEGPVASSQVSCVSCHRAHATSAPNAGRWDFSVTLLDEDGLESGSYAIPNPYGDDDQRSLCNKCHKKDEFDHLMTP
ncbi:MAG: hypothetical protein GF346_01220 [Candidatus Eisenbacteria bacterium]|nr:hypothetical protein [Candidatus Latescibacterota bacterium]MBD3301050.1 hypothetical protein [Candidatus Eisenbacteria bacterium]